MLDVRQGDQVLGPELRGYSESAIRRQRDMKYTRHVVKGLALDYDLPFGIDDSDLGIGLGPESSGIWVDVGAINRLPIW
jgi:hypothetical protein